jgi:hypothetical protein
VVIWILRSHNCSNHDRGEIGIIGNRCVVLLTVCNFVYTHG